MKKIIIGITGSIAAYKSIQLVSNLVKKGYDVEVVMTPAGAKFVGTATIEALIKKHVYIDVFDKENPELITHVDLVKDADLFFVVPASANTIAKLANGLSDNMLTDAFLAATCKKMVAPAMNVNMYENSVTQSNIKKLFEHGVLVIEPTTGLLACGDEGKGKLPDLELLEDCIEYAVSDHPLQGKTVLITAGPTQEAIDPVRYITNHSTGKMGYAIAKVAFNLGATVILISGPTNQRVPTGVNLINVVSASEMYDTVMAYKQDADIIICSAAVSDYKPTSKSEQKIKKTMDTFELSLSKNKDILKELGQNKHCKLVGFAMETENLYENASNKLFNKNCDMIVANSLNQEGAGFGVDTNIATLITKDGACESGLVSKEELAKLIFKQLGEL